MIKSTKTHSGQYRPYGDSFHVWEIETDEPIESVRKYCFTELYLRPALPTEEEWRAATRVGGERANDISYYFDGYYTLKETATGYTFTVCKPYTD